MAKKIKLTEGVLARDKVETGGDVTFWPATTMRQMVLPANGFWNTRMGVPLTDYKVWSPISFDRIYGLKDEHGEPNAPTPGKKMAIKTEL